MDMKGVIGTYVASFAVIVALALLLDLRGLVRRGLARWRGDDIAGAGLAAAGAAAMAASGPAPGGRGPEMPPAAAPAAPGQAVALPRAALAQRPASRLASDREFLPAALEILDTPPSPIATTLMLAICAMMVAALAWSWFGQLDIHAVAPGKILASGRTKVVQPLEAGRVAAIHVKGGAHVAEGDLLVELDPTETTADLEALKRELESVSGEAARRRSGILSAKYSNFKPLPVAYAMVVGEAVRRRETDLLAAELDQLRTSVEGLKAQRDEKTATIKKLNLSIDTRKKLLALTKERVGMREEIRTRGAGSRALTIDAEVQYENFATSDATDRGQLLEAEAAIKSLDVKIEQTVASFVAEQTQKAVEVDRRRDKLEQEIVKAGSRSDRTRLKAPIAGTVQQVDVTTIGQVVSSGQPLLGIVPDGSPLEVVAMVANRDIGFVRTGERAVVKVEAFPFTRYGTIEAEVARISTDAVEERNVSAMMDAATAARGQPGTASQAAKGAPGAGLVFPATLKLDTDTMMVDGRRIRLSPGMAVTVEIKTGQRRAISYILAPLSEVLSTTARER